MIDRITEQPFCQTRVMCRAVDNLELLLSQPDESVDLIYCDILYGTGRNFGDYQDLKPIRSEIESHYLPRLIEMKRVLKQNGSIYLQMDTRVNHWIRCLMDDVFGYDNFVNEIIWCYTMPNNNKRRFNAKHDNILMYSKGKDYVFNWQSVLWFIQVFVFFIHFICYLKFVLSNSALNIAAQTLCAMLLTAIQTGFSYFNSFRVQITADKISV